MSTATQDGPEVEGPAIVPDRRNAKWSLVTAALTALMLLGAYAYGVRQFGAIESALSYFKGARVIADQPIRRLGRIDPGQRLIIPIEVRNWTGHPVTVIGARTSCSCAVVGHLPATITQGGRQSIDVEVAAPGESGPFGSAITLYTDDASNPEVRLMLEGEVVSRQ